jgi:hypothetical protein
MFITMKEYVKYYRCVFAFQVLLAHLDKWSILKAHFLFFFWY